MTLLICSASNVCSYTLFSQPLIHYSLTHLPHPFTFSHTPTFSPNHILPPPLITKLFLFHLFIFPTPFSSSLKFFLPVMLPTSPHTLLLSHPFTSPSQPPHTPLTYPLTSSPHILPSHLPLTTPSHLPHTPLTHPSHTPSHILPSHSPLTSSPHIFLSQPPHIPPHILPSHPPITSSPHTLPSHPPLNPLTHPFTYPLTSSHHILP